MHKRIKNFVSGGDDEGVFVSGKGVVSYYSGSEDSLKNLIIYGNTDMYGRSLGVLDEDTNLYNVTVRIHGRSFMGAEEFFAQMRENLGTSFDGEYNEDLFTYSFNSYSPVKSLTKPGCPAFKEDTVYTIRFRYHGTPNSTTGIAVKYTDGSREDIISGDTEDCEIAFTTVKYKSVECLAPSYAFTERGAIYTSTFGIFEGETDYDDFEKYTGTTYTLKFERALYGITGTSNAEYDTFDWKMGQCVHKIHYMSVTESDCSLHDGVERPIVVKVSLDEKCQYPNPISFLRGFEYRENYSDILGNVYFYTFADENAIYVTANLGIGPSSFASLFSPPQRLFFKAAERKYSREQTCIDIPKLHSGYIGIEVFGGIEAGCIKAFYKK